MAAIRTPRRKEYRVTDAHLAWGCSVGAIRCPRLVVIPTWHDRLGEFEKASSLPQRLKEEIEQFFLSATFFTGKDARIEGWRGARAASTLIERTRRG